MREARTNYSTLLCLPELRNIYYLQNHCRHNQGHSHSKRLLYKLYNSQRRLLEDHVLSLFYLGGQAEVHIKNDHLEPRMEEM